MVVTIWAVGLLDAESVEVSVAMATHLSGEPPHRSLCDVAKSCGYVCLGYGLHFSFTVKEENRLGWGVEAGVMSLVSSLELAYYISFENTRLYPKVFELVA
jgi:hypothetical protein